MISEETLMSDRKRLSEIDSASESHKFAAQFDNRQIDKYISEIMRLRSVLGFYAKGIHAADDMWTHPEFGRLVGRRARKALGK